MSQQNSSTIKQGHYPCRSLFQKSSPLHFDSTTEYMLFFRSAEAKVGRELYHQAQAQQDKGVQDCKPNSS